MASWVFPLDEKSGRPRVEHTLVCPHVIQVTDRQTKVCPTLNLSQLRCDNGNIEHARRNRGDGGRTESAIVSLKAVWLDRDRPPVLARSRAGNEEGLLADAH